MNILKQGAIFIIASGLHAVSNYFCFGLVSSIGYAGKTNSIIFKMLGFVEQILWLPLGVLQFTKLWYLLEWGYPTILIVNSFIAIGGVYLLIFLEKPLWQKVFVAIIALFLLWIIFLILGILFGDKWQKMV